MDTPEIQLVSHEYHPFYRMCWMAAHDLSCAEQELDELEAEYPGEKRPRSVEKESIELIDEMRRTSIAAPVFALMAAEQLIFTYAFHRMLGKFKVALEHLDRLDTESKWRVIPPLVCGNELDRNSKALAELRLLNRYRNSFVHPKPSFITNLTDEKIDRFGRRMEGNDVQRYALAKRAPSILVHLADELRQTDKHRTVRTVIRYSGIPFPDKA